MQGRYRLCYVTRMDLTIRQLSGTDSAAFKQVLAIYRDAIEPSEQRPEVELRVALARTDYVTLAAERGGQVVGFSISWLPGGEGFWLFEYAATVPAERGRGIGALLFEKTAAMAGTARTGLVEADAAHDEMTARRLRFYARLGCRKIEGIGYLLPLRTHGVPPPMLLLAHVSHSAETLLQADLRRYLSRIYVSVYGQAVDDPRIGLMLGGLPMDVPLTDLDPATP
jgi:GNAT superfamily N-acetyltransferase